MLSRTNDIALEDNQHVDTFVRSRWYSTAAWSGLILLGQTASLQMIDAGRLIHFQHYRSISELVEHYPTALMLFGLQFVCVGFGTWLRRGGIGDWLKKFKWWQLAATLLFLTFASAAVTPDASIYLTSLAIGGFVQLTSIANIILLVASIPQSVLESIREKIDRFLTVDDDAKSEGASLDRFVWIATLWVVLLSAALSYFVYQAHPHVPDESQYIFQANYMAAGQLTVTPPRVPEAFEMYMVPTQEPRWFGLFPPGWPALLMLGTIVGANWIVNPLLAGLCVLMAYLLFQRLYSRRIARIAVLLLCCSPWFIFMGMSYMSHMATLVFALAAFLLLLRGMERNKIVLLLLAGVAVGIVGLIRPLDGAIVGVLLALWGLLKGETWKARLTTPIVLMIGTAGAMSLGLLYNQAVTGNAGLTPSDAYYNKYFWPNVMALGFGPERGMHWGLDAFPGHSPLEAIVNTALNVFLLNTELFGWAAGSLILAFIFAISGGISRKDLWAVTVVVFVVGAYSLFWYHGGPDLGARYWFLCIIPLIALTVRGMEWLGGLMREHQTRMSLAMAAMCILSLISYIPWRASDKYYHYLGMQPGIEQLAKQFNFGKSLVIVRGAEHPDYQSAWVYNPVNFDGNAPVYAFDKSSEIYLELLNSYGDRPIWIVNGPTLTNDNYSIVRGPVDASVLLQEMN